MKNTKIKDILIEAAKEAEKMYVTPWPSDIEHEHEMFIKAVATDNTIGIRKYGKKLAAMIMKVVTEKC